MLCSNTRQRGENMFSDIRIVIGANHYHNNPGWIHTQKEELNLLDRNYWIQQYTPNSISAILAEHVWEHLTYSEGVLAAKVCFEFLKPQGYIRCAVPDGFFPNKDYQKVIQIGGPGPKNHPAFTHQIVHNYKTLTEMFQEAGFQITLLEYCDENGEFHFIPWNARDGFIYRSFRYDHRNKNGELHFASLILDAFKPFS
jgi:predicted SAM-dependent methyltransferase